MRFLAVSIIFFLLALKVHAQTKQEFCRSFYLNKAIPEASSICQASNGDILITGGKQTPYILRIDSLGNEVFYRDYPEIFKYSGSNNNLLGTFFGVQTDQEGDIWLHGDSDKTGVFFMKIDNKGDILCFFNRREHKQLFSNSWYNWHQTKNTEFFVNQDYVYLVSQKVQSHQVYVTQLLTFTNSEECPELLSTRTLEAPLHSNRYYFYANTRVQHQDQWHIISTDKITQFDHNNVESYDLELEEKGSTFTFLLDINALGYKYFWNIDKRDPLSRKHYFTVENQANEVLVEKKLFPLQNDRVQVTNALVTDHYGIITAEMYFDTNTLTKSIVVQRDYEFNAVDSFFLDHNEGQYIAMLDQKDDQFIGGQPIDMHLGRGVAVYKFKFNKLEPAIPFGNESLTHSEGLEMKVFPNPASNQMNIQFNQPITGEITIIDIAGRIVSQYNISNSLYYLIDVAFLDAGVYQILVEDEATFKSKSFIKN